MQPEKTEIREERKKNLRGPRTRRVGWGVGGGGGGQRKEDVKERDGTRGSRGYAQARKREGLGVIGWQN